MKLRLSLLLITVTCIVTGFMHLNTAAVEYVCTPCGSDCDNKVYTKPGACEACHMPLVDKQTVQFTNLTPKQVCAKLNDPHIIILDVRTAGEYNGTSGKNYGHLKNAINIPIQELEKRMGELNSYKEKEIIVYCSHSGRSPRASHMLVQQGFKKIINMSGGISTWESSADCKEGVVK